MKGLASSRRISRRLLLVMLVLLGLITAFFFQTDPPPHRAARVDNIAHGGAQGHAPANTLEAFRLALEQGATVLEMDLQLTKDGEVVVIHNETVDETTNGSGKVRELTLERIKALDAGWAYQDDNGGHPYRGRGVTIPTLVEVLEAFPETPMIMELKTEGGQALIEPVIKLISRYQRVDDVLLASFSLEFLRVVRERLPDIATNMPEAESTAFFIRQLFGLHPWWKPPGEALQVPQTHDLKLGPLHLSNIRVPTSGFVQAAHRIGLTVQVWTVNRPEDMHRLLDAGVDGIITDYPDRLTAVIEERRANRFSVTGADVLTRYAPQIERSEYLQSNWSWLTPVMHVAAFLGDEEFYLLAFPILYWSVSAALGIRLGFMLLLTAGINSILKLAFATPRPVFLKPEVGLVSETSFGLPSGHAQNAAAVWGTQALLLKRWWLTLALIGLILLIGWSRIHLGAHFLEDIVLGWFVGGLLVLGYFLLAPRVEGWWHKQHSFQQVAAIFTFSFFLIATAALFSGGLLGWAPFWPGLEDPGAAMALSHTVSPAGTLLGYGLGLMLLQHSGGYDSGGSVWQRLGRIVLGFIGVLILWQGLGALFPRGETLLALSLRYLRYALVGFWIVGLAPAIFVGLGLARHEHKAG